MWKRTPKETPVRVPTAPVEYPAGIALETESGLYMLNRNGRRYKIRNSRVFDSWKFPRLVKSSEAALSKYPIAQFSLGFRDGTLLEDLSDGKLYMVSAGTLRHIIDPDVLVRLQVTREDAMSVGADDIKFMSRGEPIK